MLGLAIVVLIPLTIVATPLVILGVTGRGDIDVNARLVAPVTIEFEDGRAIGIDAAGDARTFINFPIGEERQIARGAIGVTGQIDVNRDDTDSRLVVAAMAIGWLAATWVGLYGLRRITASALAGEPFAAENPRRLRMVGGAIVVSAVIAVAGNLALRSTLDSEGLFEPTLGGTSVWLLVLIGTGIFALAEAFAEAARLREFEQSTI